MKRVAAQGNERMKHKNMYFFQLMFENILPFSSAVINMLFDETIFNGKF